MRAFLLFSGIASGTLCSISYAFGQSPSSLVGSQQVGTLRTAVNSVADSIRKEMSVLRAELAAFKKCAEDGKVYAPEKAGADNDGCAEIESKKEIAIDYSSCADLDWRKQTIDLMCPDSSVLTGAQSRKSDSGEWNNFTCCKLVLK